MALKFNISVSSPEISIGPDTISEVGETLDRVGARRAMVVCGSSILEASNVVDRVRQGVGGRFVGLFSNVAPH